MLFPFILCLICSAHGASLNMGGGHDDEVRMLSSSSTVLPRMPHHSRFEPCVQLLEPIPHQVRSQSLGG